jgi:hypothetical protein
MVRDADKRDRDRANGKSGGNPRLRGLSPPVNPPVESGVKAQARGRLKPRSQKPDTRKPPDPPGEAVKPPPPLPCWSDHRDRALKFFGTRFCDFWLLPCSIVPVSDSEVALDAPSKLGLSRVRGESQRLFDLFGKTVTFRLVEGAAA